MREILANVSDGYPGRGRGTMTDATALTTAMVVSLRDRAKAYDDEHEWSHVLVLHHFQIDNFDLLCWVRSNWPSVLIVRGVRL